MNERTNGWKRFRLAIDNYSEQRVTGEVVKHSRDGKQPMISIGGIARITTVGEQLCLTEKGKPGLAEHSLSSDRPPL